ncbi:MAG: KaiC domain-containing protein [Candidatus Tectimicrobiota bacterium]|nr:MAG: KaiC domain-containing protein [Candidatus Tectomicrobia bacterium]
MPPAPDDVTQRQPRAHPESVAVLRDLTAEVPELHGMPSGVKGLDTLFFVTKLERGQVRTVPLGGYPQRGVLHITGVPDTGKSLMGEQFAVQQAALGHPVCLVTTEQPAPFLVAALRQRAAAMGVTFAQIETRIVVIDAASNAALRDDVPSLLSTLAHAIKSYRVKATVIDSVTGLYEAKEMLARQVVRALYTFMKKWYQTALFISQKRSGHEELTAEAAGGYAVGHIVDGTLVLTKKEILSRYEQSLYGKPLGELVRLFRIDGCRLCGHDTRVHWLEITPAGLVEIGPPLAAVLPKAT